MSAVARCTCVTGFCAMHRNLTSATSHYAKPQKCECFNGYCIRALCAWKLAKRAAAAPVERNRARRRITRVTAWRWDGSHEKGPIAEGRRPVKSDKYPAK